MNLRNLRRAALGTVALIACTAPAADAATIGTKLEVPLSLSTLRYDAWAGEQNDLTLALTPAAATIADPGATELTTHMYARCQIAGPAAACIPGSVLPFVGVQVDLGDGADTARISGGAGRVTVWGGAGRDAITVLTGSASIYARDGEADSVTCGVGLDDVVQADATDTVAATCETVTRG